MHTRNQINIKCATSAPQIQSDTSKPLTDEQKYNQEQIYYHPLFFQNPGFQDNNTLLHEILLKISSFEEFLDKINGIDPKAIQTMSLIHNDKGQLPIDVFAFKKSSGREQIKNYLIQMMENGSASMLTDPVTVLSFNEENNVRLAENLNIAAKAATKVRQNINNSISHPQCNFLHNSYSDFAKNAQQLIEARRKINIQKTLNPNASSLAIAGHIKNIAYKHHTGNCAEFSWAVAAVLRNEENYTKSLEIFAYEEPGDHAFLVLDRKAPCNKDHENHNPAHWGEYAVICDAWAGKIYPAYQAAIYLGDFKDRNSTNCLTFFNSAWHKIKLAATINCRKKSQLQNISN